MPPHVPGSPIFARTSNSSPSFKFGDPFPKDLSTVMNREDRLTRPSDEIWKTEPVQPEPVPRVPEQADSSQPSRKDRKSCSRRSRPMQEKRSAEDRAVRQAARNKRERNRVHTIASAFDNLQSTIWREAVTANEERRPRVAFLRRAVSYISLLSGVLQETVSEDLRSHVGEFVEEKKNEDSQVRAERLRSILADHQAETETASLGDELRSASESDAPSLSHYPDDAVYDYGTVVTVKQEIPESHSVFDNIRLQADSAYSYPQLWMRDLPRLSRC